jgi:DNA-binding transcriptional ArsR family regulator
MPKYKQFEYNREVMDVLCCVILGYSRVSDIMKILKQPQSTISEKLRFLKKNKIVKKSKWVFEPNWSKLVNIARKEVHSVLKFYVGKSEKRFMELFSEERIKNIIKTYAQMVIKDKTMEFVSISEVVWKYFLGLTQTEDKELKEIDKRFVMLKKKIGALSPEKLFFIQCEE